MTKRYPTNRPVPPGVVALNNTSPRLLKPWLVIPVIALPSGARSFGPTTRTALPPAGAMKIVVFGGVPDGASTGTMGAVNATSPASLRPTIDMKRPKTAPPEFGATSDAAAILRYVDPS